MVVSLIRPWQWIGRLPVVVAEESMELLRLARQHRHSLWATTWIEFHRRYAGNVLGILWSPLYALLFLAMYAFVFLFVTPVSGAHYTRYEYVVFIFCGLIPYLGFAEALNTGTASIKANMALLKNTIFPAELIPVRQMFVSMLSLGFSLALLILMVLPTRLVGWHLLYLPVPIILLMIVSLAGVWLFSAFATLLPDINQIINLLTLMLLFISPIGYDLATIHGIPRLIALLNPLTYLIESIRYAVIGVRATPMWSDAVVFVAGLIAAGFCGAVFRRLKPLFVDNE
jgi:lipopolysaccharide transport system permease protein